MSLRDWFAGKALTGYLSADANPSQHCITTPKNAAKAAYEYADAMLAERAKNK